MQADFAKSKGNDQSGDVENEVFERLGFFLSLNMVKGRKVKGKIVICEGFLEMSQLLCVNEFEGLSPNVVNCGIL